MSDSKALAGAAARGGAVTLLAQAAKIGIHLTGLVVLARILSPADFGILAVVTIFIGIGDILRDFGLSAAAMQVREVSSQQRTNLFWLNLLIGIVLGGLCALCAQPIGRIYDNPAIGSALLALAITFILNGAQTQYQAELARSLRFTTLAVTDVLALSLGLASAIVAALMNFGYWALVGQLIVIALTRLTARVIVSRWVPGVPRRTPMSHLIRFGVNVTLTQLIVFLSSNVDRLVLGLQSSTRVVGLYQQAFQLVMTPLSQVFPPLLSVALPVLSRTAEDGDRYSRYIVAAQRALSLPLIAVFALAIAAAEPLITLVLGRQWLEATPFFQLLAVAGAFQALTYVTYWVFLSRALTASNLRYSLVSRGGIACLVIFGSFWGPIGVASGYVIGMCLAWPFSLWWLSRITELPVRALLLGGLRILTLGVVSSVTAVFGVALFEDAAIVQVIMAGLSVFGIFALAAVIPIVRRDYGELFSMFKLLRK